MKKSEFKMKSTQKQLEIIQSNEYPIYVKAGPGTGKTETLIQKIIYILETKSNSSISSMAIISFTNKAAYEMERRLLYALFERSKIAYNNGNLELFNKLRNEAYLVSISSISTIHSFCEKLLREYGLEIGISPNFKITSYLNKTRDTISKVVRKLFENNKISGIDENTLISLLFNLYKDNDNKGIIKIENNLDDEFSELLELKEIFIKMYNHISDIMIKDKLASKSLSLNDTIFKTVELLKMKSIKQKIRDKYEYIFIDEYQDTNKSQFELTKELIESNIKVFLVGDDKQAIYGFRGSDIENSKNMSDYVGSNRSNLNENFRSDPSIIKTINNIFSSTFKYKNESLRFDNSHLSVPDPNRKSEENAVLISYGEGIVKIIKDIVSYEQIRDKKIEYSDIAVLCRKNYMVDEIGRKLKNAGIPTEVIGGHGFYKAKEILDIYKFFNYMIYQRNEYKNELYLTDAYKSFVSYKLGDFDEFLTSLSNSTKYNNSESVLDYLIQNTNLEKFYAYNQNYQAIANIMKLRSMAFNRNISSFMPAMNFLDFITSKIRSNSEEDESPILDENTDKGTVSVYTVHKAKGLSFPVVIVSDIDEPLLNSKKFSKIFMECNNDKISIGFHPKVTSKEDAIYNNLLDKHILSLLEEELRILYVASTRAKYKLIFSCNRFKNSIVNSKYESWAKWVLETGFIE